MGWFSSLAPIIGAGIGAVGSIAGGALSASAQSKAAGKAAKTQADMFNQLRADQAPYRQTGGKALSELEKMFIGGDYSGFDKSPGYQFRMDEGQKAVDRSASARGLRRSGPQLKALQRYGQDYASGEFNNYANRLSSLAGLGQTATQQTGAAGMGAAGNIGQAQMAAGQARGSAYENAASSVNSGINNALFYMMQQ